jgi:hypothetical protein
MPELASEYLSDEFSIRNDLEQRLALSILILIFSDVIRNVQEIEECRLLGCGAV